MAGTPVVTDQPTPSFSSTALNTAYLGPTWTPPNGEVVDVLVVNSKTTTPTTPTLSGNGQTWEQIATILSDTIAAPTRRATAFRALIAGATAEGLTVDFGGVQQTGCLVVVISASGVDTSGSNGANSLRNIVTLAQDTGNKTASVALAAFLTTNNATVLGVGISGTETAVKDASPAGYVLATQQGYTAPAVTGAMEWLLRSDTAPQMTWVTANERWGAIGFELVADPKLGALFDAAATSGAQAGTPYSFSITIAANDNRALVVTVKLLATGSVSGITHDGVALTHDGASDVANGVFSLETWYLLAPNTGAKTITVTLAGAVASVADAAAYFNVDQAAPIEARATATGAGSIAGGGTGAVSVTTVNVGSMAVGSLVIGVISTITPAAIQNNREQTIPAAGGADLDDIGAVLTPGATAFSWPFTGGVSVPWAASAVSLRSLPDLLAQVWM